MLVEKSGWLGFLKWVRWRREEELWRSIAIGFNSDVDRENDVHIVMLDFDIGDLQKVKESIRECQDFWSLADCYVYRTKNGFHAIFFEDQVPYGRCRLIIEFARYVDQKYRYISRFYDHKTLRVAGKHADGQEVTEVCIIPGSRVPTSDERERGRLKREEHRMLRQMKVVQTNEGKQKKL